MMDNLHIRDVFVVKDKSAIRKSMKEKLAGMDAEEHDNLSLKLAENLFRIDAWKQARTIGITISNGKEVNTSPIIERAWAEGKKVAVPKCIPSSKTMVFRELKSYEELEVVYYGLKEPIEQRTREVQKSEIDLMIVPGLAYSGDGYRVGFGGGYYDRYLSDFCHETLSLAFEAQVVPSVPYESFDIPVKMIVTNERIIDCVE